MIHFIKIHQDNGKYGRFHCPACGSRGLFKFSSGSGVCPKCGLSLLDVGYFPRYMGAGEPHKVTHWRWLEVE